MNPHTRRRLRQQAEATRPEPRPPVWVSWTVLKKLSGERYRYFDRTDVRHLTVDFQKTICGLELGLYWLEDAALPDCPRCAAPATPETPQEADRADQNES